MKQSKKRENANSKKKKHNRNVLNLDSWDQTDLEDADEKVLERRLHQLRLQLQMSQDDTPHESRHSSSSKHKKKRVSEEIVSSEADSSDSESSVSSDSSSSVNKYKSKKSSSVSGDDRKKYQRGSLPKKKLSKEAKTSRSNTRNDRENNSDPKSDKKYIKRKTSPVLEKSSSRARSRKSPSLDKRDLYNRLDTGRWHDKAKEFEKERTKMHDCEQDRSRGRSRVERNRSASPQRDQRLVRSKDERKKATSRTASSVAARRKDSPEPARSRAAAYDAIGGRRMPVITRKVSPRNDRLGRHDERRLDLKVTRRNDVRSDLRDVSVRVTRDVRERKEPAVKMAEKPREREVITKPHREIIDHGRLDRDRNKLNEDRFKDRDKRVHERLEPERNIRCVRNDTRDIADDKFRRNERVVDVPRLGNNRHTNESVFDRIRNRYNDRRNAENQRLGRDRVADVRKDRPLEKELPKPRNVDTNMPERLIRERRTNIPLPIRARSLHRDRKEPERNVVERRSPVEFEKKFASPLNTRKAREADNRVNTKRKSAESDDQSWGKKKGINKVRSRSRSSEKRKRRRSSQEEWRVIDMTSPVLDDEFSDENNRNTENNVQNKKRSIANKLKPKLEGDELDDSDSNKNKTNLNDELSDISDEDFNDPNAANNARSRKEAIARSDRINENNNKVNRKLEQKVLVNRDNVEFNKTPIDNITTNNDVDDLINNKKLTDEESERVEFEKGENLDSEEETVSRVSDALGVDWTDLVEESKKKTTSNIDGDLSNVRRRWDATNVFLKIGISEKYAGENLFNEIQKDLAATSAISENSNLENSIEEGGIQERILHKVPALHMCLRNRAVKRRTLFEPYKTAISARKDIAIRRRLCGLPVKNLPSQQMIGICHWIV